ncbi:MAG: MurT ligase domain-containing protein [Acidimicrobiales bacterium]
MDAGAFGGSTASTASTASAALRSAGPRSAGPRSAAATRLGLGVAQASRRLGLGSGSVIGGRVTLALDGQALARHAEGRRLALVSGTNGKTTTTRLLSTAMGAAGPVATNSDGSNLPAGLVATLSRAPDGVPGALEVDEAWLGHVAQAVGPEVVVLLNLSRDQLDRVSEVRRLGLAWRGMVAGLPDARIVANADDPIVAWAAMASGRVSWVAAGAGWRLDSTGCPACDAQLDFEAGSWECRSCGISRPSPGTWLEDGCLATADGRRLAFDLALPGQFNRANAAMAAVAAELMGTPVTDALSAMAGVSDVGGRFQVLDLPRPGGGPGAAGGPGRGANRARLLLAKNPAGWAELLALLETLSPPGAPVVLGINARIADGRDPSWLWDVDFERLAGRFAVATGDRCADLAVRLRYAGVCHVVQARPLAALAAAASAPGAEEVLDVVANYTAFQDIRRALERSP